MQSYRDIYKRHYGEIPVDSQGRSYEIHHKDGDRNNNCLENLVAVSIQEHYDIHLKNGDYAACLIMSERMAIDPETKRLLASKSIQRRLKDGTHPWLKPEYKESQKRRANSKNNPFIGGKIQSESNQKRLRDKTHHLLGSTINLKMLAENTHPSQKVWCCEICGKTGKGMTNYIRWHGEKCNAKIQ